MRINPPSFTARDHSAIADVCAWPNLTVLPDGTLLAAIFNQPSHGQWEGDLDAWVSTDGGESWTRRACIAPHELPASNRMNCAVGLIGGGELLALCGGWFGRATTPNTPGAPFQKSQRRRPVICRSRDNGMTWSAEGELPDDGGEPIIPFGDIHVGDGGRLLASIYAPVAGHDGFCSRIISSADAGQSWQLGAVINPRGDETSILPLGDGRWLAASRGGRGPYLHQFSSEDDGETWSADEPLSLPGQVTSHLLRLHGGRVLLTYGNRCVNNYGVDARFSDDSGRTWSAPVRVADAPLSDCGYPATAALPDGRLVTAFYTQLPGMYQYEMRVAHWRLPA